MPLLALVVGAWGIALVVGESSDPEGIRGKVGFTAIAIAIAILVASLAAHSRRRPR